jgi:hypothetical protein
MQLCSLKDLPWAEQLHYDAVAVAVAVWEIPEVVASAWLLVWPPFLQLSAIDD